MISPYGLASPPALRVRPQGRSMMAAVLVAPGCFEIREVPLPKPGPAEVRVRLEGCGVNPLREESPLPPGAPGHEGWGIIDALGSEVEGWSLGERVGILSRHAYAQYDVAPARNLVRIPESLAGEPFPAEPLGGAVNIFRRSGINKGDTVAIVGIGFLGALLVQLAALAEARVIAVGRRAWALEIARQFGAAQTVAIEDDPGATVRAVEEITDGAGCDLVIEATGCQKPLDLAAELTRERGRLLIAGNHCDGPRLVNLPLWSRRGIDVINAHERSPAICREGMSEAAAVVGAGLMTPGPLYTHRFALERVGEAARLAARRPAGFMKALVEF